MAITDIEGFSASTNIDDFTSGGLLWNAYGQFGSLSIGTGGQFGDNYLNFNVSGGGSATRVLPAAYTTFFGGFRCASNFSLETGAEQIVDFRDANAASQISLAINLFNGVLTLRCGGTVLGSTPPQTFPNTLTWQYLEVGAVISATNGSATVRLNGGTVLSVTGVDTANTPSTANVAQVAFQPMNFGGRQPAVLRIQHFYFCDDTGPAPNNNFLGDVRVQQLRPNGPGAATDFTHTGAATNWQAAATTPPQPSAIYNQSSTVGATDLFAVTPMDGGSDRVFGVCVKALAAKATAGTRQAATLVRSGSTQAAGSPVYLGTTPTYLRQVFSTDPATNAPWTPAGINALQVGYKIVS